MPHPAADPKGVPKVAAVAASGACRPSLLPRRPHRRPPTSLSPPAKPNAGRAGETDLGGRSDKVVAAMGSRQSWAAGCRGPFAAAAGTPRGPPPGPAGGPRHRLVGPHGAHRKEGPRRRRRPWPVEGGSATR